jgi:SAM-dependent methyltransferase
MTITSCRSCGAAPLDVVLSLGRTPLANSLLTAEQLDEPEETYPLELAFCRGCSLLQITETVPPERLFRDYLYFSSYSDTMVRHAQVLVEELIGSRDLDRSSLVVEVASNDGYLLRFYREAGIPVLGIEPAGNVARVAREEHGIPTLCEFFDVELADRLVADGKQGDVLHAHNVLAHAADLNGFVAGIERVVKPGGVAVLEVPYVKDMLDRCEFDTVYHEHLCYFSATSLHDLFRRNALAVEDVERVPVHGGSLRLAVGRGQPGAAVQALLDEEAGWGVGEVETYRAFGERVERLKQVLRELLAAVKGEGARVAAYGAAAKGSTLLNSLNIGAETVDFVVDRSTHKQGRFMPGVHLPIYAPETLLERRPDYVLLLTWNLADEILEQQDAYRRAGGKFIVPVPEPQVV